MNNCFNVSSLGAFKSTLWIQAIIVPDNILHYFGIFFRFEVVLKITLHNPIQIPGFVHNSLQQR